MTGSLTVAVVLAAGSGTRFIGSTHKLLSVAQGRPVYHWAIESAIEASIGPVLVVTGKTPLPLDFAFSDQAQASIAKWGLPHSINNSNWSTGMASSVQSAVQFAASLGAEAVVTERMATCCQQYFPTCSCDIRHQARQPRQVACRDVVSLTNIRRRRSAQFIALSSSTCE
jgi:hypothetical protein